MNRQTVTANKSLLWSTLLLAALLVLSGCSSTRMAYRYADWGVVWWVEDYVTLTDAQKTQLYEDLDELRGWHCATELPKYQVWLNTLETDVRQQNITPEALSQHQDELLGFFPPLLSRATPIATRLLTSLTDAQVRELTENMAERQRELEQEYLGEDPAATAAARAERTSERLERWLGDLNDNQRAIVTRWSAQRDRQTEIWLQGRRNWQLTFLEALERRQEPGFEQEVARLLNESTSIRGEEYEAMMARSRVALNTLIHGVVAAGDTAQLAHLENRAAELNRDFEALTCSPGPEIAES
ncbi:DUF6279 family lipoprotein [Marinobacter alexandrii]|uniref:DUF6279 family lipoprotein n=1 Tax=Marinobacter alexandrii TaxID=2570351 RepID=UPI001FFFEF7F|nr:DUF6279 family lipoprotein [Marinobacter alexandrii]MCK2149335.1 DUF6279 family lipoprotein [Marinobacter alexandrii]